MAARSIATASISFGLVTVPVRIYPATRASAGLSFHLLHEKDHARLKQQYVCEKDGKVVPRSEMVKGYEYAKGRYVTFTNEELKALDQKATNGIEIAEFVPEGAVDPVYFERSYYLGPDQNGAKAFSLLGRAMKETGLLAVAKYAARGKDYLVLLRPADERLEMIQLYNEDEVRPASEVPVETRAATAGGGEAGHAPHRVHRLPRVRPRQVRRRGPPPHPEADPGQGPGQGHHRACAAEAQGGGDRPHGGAAGQPGPPGQGRAPGGPRPRRVPCRSGAWRAARGSRRRAGSSPAKQVPPLDGLRACGLLDAHRPDGLQPGDGHVLPSVAVQAAQAEVGVQLGFPHPLPPQRVGERAAVTDEHGRLPRDPRVEPSPPALGDGQRGFHRHQRARRDRELREPDLRPEQVVHQVAEDEGQHEVEGELWAMVRFPEARTITRSRP